MDIKTIASGSGGNFYVLTAPSGAQLMVECGIPWKKILQGMGFDFRHCLGCLISHEHTDHSAAIKQMVKHGIKIFSSAGTLNELNVAAYGIYGPQPLKKRTWTSIGDFAVMPIPAIHDAAEPFMFIIKDSEDTLLFATDTQYIPYQIKGLTKIMVEANYSMDVLNENYIENGDVGPRRRRIINTHLGIDSLVAWLWQGLHAGAFDTLKEIHLIHMSKENADPHAFQTRIQKLTGKPVFIE